MDNAGERMHASVVLAAILIINPVIAVSTSDLCGWWGVHAVCDAANGAGAAAVGAVGAVASGAAVVVGAAGAVLSNALGGGAGGWGGVGNWIQGGVQAVAQPVVSAVGAVLSNPVGAIGGALDGVVHVLTTGSPFAGTSSSPAVALPSAAPPAASSSGGGVVGAVLGAVGGAVGTVASVVGNGASGAAAVVNGAWDSASGLVNAGVQSALGGTISAAQFLTDPIGYVEKVIVGFLYGLISAVFAFFAGMIYGAFQWIAEGIAGGYGTVGGAFNLAGQGAAKVYDDFWDALQGALSDILYGLPASGINPSTGGLIGYGGASDLGSNPYIALFGPFAPIVEAGFLAGLVAVIIAGGYSGVQILILALEA